MFYQSVLLVVMFSSLSILWAQEGIPRAEPSAIKVRGTVRVGDTVVPAASVVISGLETGVRKNTITDAQGSFEVTGLPPGQYRATVMLDGFATRDQDFTVSVGETATLEFVFGGPVPIGEPDSDTDDIVVVRKAFSGDLELKGWLNRIHEEGRRVRAIVPLEYTVSLFVLESSEGADSTVMAVQGALASEELQARIELEERKSFVGVHRLGPSSYLLVFVDE